MIHRKSKFKRTEKLLSDFDLLIFLFKMLSKRVMVVAADKTLQKRLSAGAMAAGGAVQTFASLDEATGRVEFDLALVELAPRIVPDALTPPGPAVMPPAVVSLAARLPDGARLVPILPAPDLEWMTALLADARVARVLVADVLTAEPGDRDRRQAAGARSVRRREGAALGRAHLLGAGRRLQREVGGHRRHRRLRRRPWACAASIASRSISASTRC